MAKIKSNDHNTYMPVCRICGSKKTILKYVKEKYKYYQCPDCLILFLHPIPSKKSLDMYYQKEFRYTAGLAEEKRLKQKATEIVDRLTELNPSGKSLLDIGSGYGVFLQEAKNHIQEITGIEPSKSLYNYSASYVKEHMMNIDFQTFLKKNRAKFDFITLIHVIEHLPDPKKILRQIISLLKPNGVLYIETPNIDSRLYYSEGKNYTFLTPPDHIYLFSPFAFQEMIKNSHNIRIQNISTSSHPEHFMGILKRKWRITDGKSQINTQLQKSNKEIQPAPGIKIIKYYLFDKIIAPLCTPLLNTRNKGSILEIYLRKIPV